MSGGHYDYVQYRLYSLEDEIDADLLRARKHMQENDEDIFFEVNSDLIRDLEVTKNLVGIVGALVHELDWFLSGDTGIDSYRIRLNKGRVTPEFIRKMQELLKEFENEVLD